MNEVDDIKERLDIAELIAQYIELKKAGSNYKALCPFHREKTPSFMVSPERQIFKCFGCDSGGDIFEFVMKMENLTFPEALEMLAQKAGVVLPKFEKNKEAYKKEIDTKTKIYKINKISALVFQKILRNYKYAQNAREYLAGRKINSETIDKFMIGFAPNKKILGQFLQDRHFTFSEIKLAGNPEKFYERIMFPIFDVLGNVVAFTGRTLNNEVQPKYLNTPETPIFHKSKILYGLNFAKNAVKNEKFTIVLEGQMDVILSHQAGVENVVATSGTSLTSDHLKIISRYSGNIAFCFDSDDAGFNALKKAIMLAYEMEISPFSIKIPEGFKDVGELVEKDPKIWQEVAKNKKPALEFLIESIFAQYPRELNSQDKKNLVKELIPYLLVISDPMEERLYKKTLAQKLGVPERIIDETMEKFSAKNKKKNIVEPTIEKTRNLNEEELLLGILFSHVEFLPQILGNLTLSDFDQDQNQDIFTVYKEIFTCYNLNKLNKNAETTDCEKILSIALEKIPADLAKKVEFLILQQAKDNKNIREEISEEEIFDFIAKIKGKKNQKIKDSYANLISQAEAKKDIGLVKKLVKEFQEKISTNK